MKYISEIITALNLFFIFLTPLVIILIKKNINKRNSLVISILFSSLVSSYYLFQMKQNIGEVNYYERFFNKIKERSNSYQKEDDIEESFKLYKDNFKLQKVSKTDLNKQFMIGISWHNDRSQIEKFLNIYSKLLSKSPHTCQSYIKNKILLNDKFFEYLSKLEDEDEKEIVRIISESILYYYVGRNTKRETCTEEQAQDNEGEEEKFLNEKEASDCFSIQIHSYRKELKNITIPKPMVDTEKIEEECRQKTMEFSNFSGEDIYYQEKYINKIATEAWNALK